jgi:hypothetical protein
VWSLKPADVDGVEGVAEGRRDNVPLRHGSHKTVAPAHAVRLGLHRRRREDVLVAEVLRIEGHRLRVEPELSWGIVIRRRGRICVGRVRGLSGVLSVGHGVSFYKYLIALIAVNRWRLLDYAYARESPGNRIGHESISMLLRFG